MEHILRKVIMASIAFFSLTISSASAYADGPNIVWRPAIDAIGNAEEPATEGVAGLPDGVDFGPTLPSGHGKVTVDDSTTTLPPTVHSRRRKTLVIGR